MNAPRVDRPGHREEENKWALDRVKLGRVRWSDWMIGWVADTNTLKSVLIREDLRRSKRE
jgi:hypothetical protein